jgi:lauroyl/myristoyl acyltransferase
VEFILVFIARCAFSGIRALPLRGAARLGRFLGWVTFLIDRRHRRVALTNIKAVYSREKSPKEIHELARENFRRIGENFASGICMAGLVGEKLDRVLEVVGLEKVIPNEKTDPPPSRILAIGHFGNFEIFSRVACMFSDHKTATTYHAIKPEALNDLLLSYRESSNLVFLERTRDAAKLKSMLKAGGIVLGLVCDQSGGARGVHGPFMGIGCSTSAAPAAFARRFNYPLYTTICYRIGLAKWRIEFGDEIPLHEGGELRTAEAITEDMNKAFDRAVRRDPANWFWVHNRWKLVESQKHSMKVSSSI